MTAKAKELLDSSIEGLAKAVDKAACSEAVVNWLNAMSRFHKYSAANAWLIAWQRQDATKVASLRTWNQMGRRVKKGERGIAILVPVPYPKPKDEDVTEEEDEKGRKIFFKTGYVFDISQTEGEPLPATPQWWTDGDADASLLAAIERGIRSEAIVLSDAPYLGGARGVSMGGEICVLDCLTPLARAKTLLHEWAHELQRREGWFALSKEQKEQEADAVAYVALRSLGLDAHNAPNYIVLWNGDAAKIKANMKRIHRFASHILDVIETQYQ